MIKTLILDKEESDFEFDFNPEQPYLNVLSIEFLCDNAKLSHLDVFVQYTVIQPDSRTAQGNLARATLGRDSNQEVDLRNAESASARFKIQKETVPEDVKVEIQYETLNKLNVSNPLLAFEKHLVYPANNKIIFSAPFGHGKSTFLDVFFEEKKEKYNVFKVYPVNYSVASNQDIFRYIKTDILFQLLNYELDFEKTNISYGFAAQELIIQNIKKVISTSLHLYFSIDKSNAHLGKALTKLEKVLAKIKSKKKELGVDEKSIVESYLEEVYEEEGSIYEDNLYTQLIRVFLEQLKVDNEKKNVLVIEDLDRMDPEHIFRILNIISAHFDTYRLKDNQEPNKFGFDKIIVVGDLNNLEHLFAHKYGSQVDFSGYINKFFSTGPFYYNNNSMYRYIIDEYYNKAEQVYNIDDWKPPFNLVFNLLIKGKQISLRDFIKLSHYSLVKQIDTIRKQSSRDHYSKQGLFMPIIGLLSKTWSQNQLISKIENCKNRSVIIERINLNKNCSSLIAPIGTTSVEKNFTNVFKYHGDLLYYNVDTGRSIDETIITESHIFYNKEKSTIDNIAFNWDDFYDLLIDNVKKYYQIMGGDKI